MKGFTMIELKYTITNISILKLLSAVRLTDVSTGSFNSSWTVLPQQISSQHNIKATDQTLKQENIAYLCRVCQLKEEGRQLKCQRKNRKSRAVQNFIFLRSIAQFCMLCSQNAEILLRASCYKPLRDNS